MRTSNLCGLLHPSLPQQMIERPDARTPAQQNQQHRRPLDMRGLRLRVRMLKLEELSLLEASAASGMSIASLKVATHRALKKLRAVIGKAADRT